MRTFESRRLGAKLRLKSPSQARGSLKGGSSPLVLGVALLLCALALHAPILGQTVDLDPLDVVRLPTGRFTMGCVLGDSGCEAHELPRHDVRLTHDVWMSRTETTVQAYAAFAKSRGHRTRAEVTGRGRDWNHAIGQWEWVNGLSYRVPYADGTKAEGTWPAVQVAWSDADTYCRWAGGRLPSEAEWEYGARGGKAGEKYPWGDAPTPQVGCNRHANGPDERTRQLFPRWDIFAGYDDGSPRLAGVGQFTANHFGLLDMAGNAWEWVNDWHSADYYKTSPTDDPAGSVEGTARIVRGGSWGYAPKQHRNSERGFAEPEFWTATFGFRCVFDQPPTRQ